MRDIIVRVLRKLSHKLLLRSFLPPECDVSRQSANDRIFDLLSENTPTMISRFGTVEINCVNNYLVKEASDSYISKMKNFLTDSTQTPWWNKRHFKFMHLNAGVFPATVNTMEEFSKLYLDLIPEIDLLGSHQYQEKFMPLRNDVVRVHLEMLYPFFVKRPWTRILKGKKVLVVHPFEDTIKHQYKNRTRLFVDENILPEFKLLTYRTVQSLAGNPVGYNNWFDALEKMKHDITSIDFDFALIGCGAYGLPIAAHVKDLGKKAIHMGGGLQLLFGILGNRWVKQYKAVWNYRPGVVIDTDYKPLFNQDWIYPLSSDRPKNTNVVEDSCYWN